MASLSHHRRHHVTLRSCRQPPSRPSLAVSTNSGHRISIALITERSIFVQPLGAIEQHGPHLPFNTDLLIADRVATAAVERVGAEHDVWLLPPLAYTKSNEHAWSSGTIWLSADTLLRVLDDIGRCVAMTPARRLVFMNGHGGNSALVGVANRELRLHHGLMTFLAHPGVPPDQGGVSAADEHGMGIHGGTDETSIMLHLAPELVDMGAAVAEHPGGARREPSRPFRWHGRLRMAVERLRTRRPHRRSDDGDRRARRRTVRRRGRRRSVTPSGRSPSSACRCDRRIDEPGRRRRRPAQALPPRAHR